MSDPTGPTGDKDLPRKVDILTTQMRELHLKLIDIDNCLGNFDNEDGSGYPQSTHASSTQAVTELTRPH